MGQLLSAGKGGQDGTKNRFSCVCTPIQTVKGTFWSREACKEPCYT